MKDIARAVVVSTTALITHRSIYTLTGSITERVLRTVELDALNPHNWIGQAVGVASIAGEIWVLLKVSDILSQRRRRRSLIHRLQQWGTTVVSSVTAGAIAYSICHIIDLPNPPKFLLSLLVGAATASAIAEGTIEWQEKLLRGFRLRKPGEISAMWFWRYTHTLIPWGEGFIKPEREPLHFAVVGNTGMGKSSFLMVMMSRLRGLAGVDILPDMRAIILDAKRELVPLLSALGVPFKIWNPMDCRCVGWAIGEDIQGEGMADEFAKGIVFETSESQAPNNPYFPNVAQVMIRNVVTALWNACGDQWTLRHLILVCSKADNIKALLQKHHPRPNEVEELLKNKKERPNEVLTTVQSKLYPLAIVAARWEAADEKQSLKEWLKREEVMVLGTDHLYQQTLKLTNMLILRFMGTLLNNLPASKTRRIWLYIDEAAAAGRFVSLESLVALGRGAGVCVVIAFQNIASFMETYSDNLAKSILGLCRHWAIFGVDMPSAQWIAAQIGEHEAQERTVTSSSKADTPNSVAQSYQQQTVRKPTVLSQEFMDLDLPQTGPESGEQVGFFISPGEGIHRHSYDWSQIRRWQIDPFDEETCPSYLRVSDVDPSLSLEPLSEEERRLFGIDQ